MLINAALMDLITVTDAVTNKFYGRDFSFLFSASVSLIPKGLFNDKSVTCFCASETDGTENGKR